MNKRSYIVIAVLLILASLTAYATKLVPYPAEDIDKKSSYILIGQIKKVIFIEEDNFEGENYKIHIDVISYLKGNKNTKTLVLSLWRGGLMGFDIIPEKEMIGIFFLSSIEGEQGMLTAPGSIALFEKGYFKK